MKIHTRTLVLHLTLALFAGSCWCSRGTAAPRQEPHFTNRSSPLTLALDTLMNDTALAECFLGIGVRVARTDSVLYERNSGKLFHPASNMKLFTTATALHELRKDFRFQTRLFISGTVADGILHGNLCVA